MSSFFFKVALVLPCCFLNKSILTRNSLWLYKGGSPCKDLAIGFSDLDIEKYNLLVKTTSKTIELLETRGRNDIAEKNKKNLDRYLDILNTLEGGNVIFGRIDRIMKKR